MSINTAQGARSVVVYGPQACGKTRNRKRIASKLGLETILDDYWPEGPRHAGRIPSRGVLVIAHCEEVLEEVQRRCPGIRVMPYSEAAQRAGVR